MDSNYTFSFTSQRPAPIVRLPPPVGTRTAVPTIMVKTRDRRGGEHSQRVRWKIRR